MICYIMCILLWIAYLWLDCMVVAYAFEPRRDSVRQAGIILGLMAAQLPAAVLKFLFNDNVLVRYGAMIAVGIVTVAYAAVFLKGTIGQKVLFMLCEYLTALLAEMLSIGILNKYMEQKPQLSYYTPTMVLLLSVVLTVTAIFFLIFLVVWKKIVEKESFDVSIIIVFSVFPVSQLLMITAINEQVFRNMTLYTGWILAAAILGSVADGVLLYTLLRQQQLQELKLRLSEVQSTWEIAENHYHEIENRREEFAKIRHDMRNQQMVLQELLHQGEYEKAEKMLETLTDTVAATTEYLYCGDPVFNAIMGETEKACREKRIAFQYDLEIPQKLKLDPVAICSILSNLTRNAVAAAEMTEREEAFLSVKAAVKGDYLHICVENSRAKKLPGRPGRKGYGLEILHDLVERNHGQIDVQPGEGSFRVDVTVENCSFPAFLPFSIRLDRRSSRDFCVSSGFSFLPRAPWVGSSSSSSGTSAISSGSSVARMASASAVRASPSLTGADSGSFASGSFSSGIFFSFCSLIVYPPKLFVFLYFSARARRSSSASSVRPVITAM